jgi:hypothetical protein
MTHRILPLVTLCLAGCQVAPAKLSLNDLSMEVNALYIIYQLQLTPDQLRALAKLAPETAGDAEARETPKAGEAYRRVLTKLREALADPKDDDQIADLVEELDERHEKEAPHLDDGVTLTDGARKRTPEFLRLLSARQLRGYLESIGDEVSDPLETLREALDRVRGMSGDEWRDFRRIVGPQVGSLVAGLDAERANRVSDRVVQWLIGVRALSDAEFKAQRAELEAEARKLVGDVGPLEVLRHFVEHDLAELLSNPRLAAAVAARLK